MSDTNKTIDLDFKKHGYEIKAECGFYTEGKEIVYVKFIDGEASEEGKDRWFKVIGCPDQKLFHELIEMIEHKARHMIEQEIELYGACQ